MKYTIDLFKTLSDETRLRIINLLSGGELCVCDLNHSLGIPQSTVSRHLAHLKNIGIIANRRSKTWVYYRLSEDVQPLVGEILAVLTRHLSKIAQIQKDLDALQSYKNNPERSC